MNNKRRLYDVVKAYDPETVQLFTESGDYLGKYEIGTDFLESMYDNQVIRALYENGFLYVRIVY